jgi:hypothetical protein
MMSIYKGDDWMFQASFKKTSKTLLKEAVTHDRYAIISMTYLLPLSIDSIH